jgi:hypothetical protein
MAPTVSQSTVSPESPELKSVFDGSETVFGGYPNAGHFPSVRTPQRSDKTRTVAYVAVAVAALSLVVNAVFATIMVMQSRQSLAVPIAEAISPAVTQASDVDRTCVAVLHNGGRPQDCARMYLTSEFPGFP